MDERFASAGIKWYYVHDPVNDLKGEALVRASRDNVLIETLKTGTLGLPIAAEPIYLVEHPSGVSLAILAPPILLLTKMKRWYFNHESTRPKTISKNQSDKSDLDFLIVWLFVNEMKINFDLYKGKEKPELLKFVKAYRDSLQDNKDLMEVLEAILHEEDWGAIQNMPETSTSEPVLPPEPGSRSDLELGLAPEPESRTELASPSELGLPTEQRLNSES